MAMVWKGWVTKAVLVAVAVDKVRNGVGQLVAEGLEGIHWKST